MANPYWHDEYKPHLIDRDEIRLLCFEIDCIVAASMGRQGTGAVLNEEERPAFTILDHLCFCIAEAQLSRRLLRLALLVRTFDDTMNRSDAAADYANHRERIQKDHQDFGDVFESEQSITQTIRECSNKIIHAEDVRPVYQTDDDRTDSNATWGMNGTLELEGVQGRAPWKIAIYLRPYLEGVLELIQFNE